MTAPVSGSGAEPTCTALVSKCDSSNDMRCSKLAWDSTSPPFNTTKPERGLAPPVRARSLAGSPGRVRSRSDRCGNRQRAEHGQLDEVGVDRDHSGAQQAGEHVGAQLAAWQPTVGVADQP